MSWFKEASSTIGLEEDQFKAIFALVLSILISPIYRIVTNRNGRNAFSIIIGFAILYFMFEEWAFITLACTIIPFFLCRLSSKPFFVSIICSVIMLLIVHGYRFVTIHSIWKVDSSVAIMLLVAKLTYYGKWLEKREKSEISFLDYLSYNLFVPSVVAGPTFSFDVYLSFLNNKFDVSLKKIKFGSALHPLGVAIPLIVLSVFVMPVFHTRWVLENEFYLSLGFLTKILVMIVVGFFYRLKYYVAWYLAQGGINLSGLSLDAEGQYSTVKVASLKFQTETNLRARTEYWNTSNQLWLKEVVYYGWKQYTSEQVAFFGTFLTSAFWHGLYLTYYVGFVYWGMLVHINKWVYKWSQTIPKFANSKLAEVGAFVAGGTLFGYIGMFMAILNWDNAVAFHAGVHYWGTFVLLGLVVCSFVIVPPRKKGEKTSE